MKLNEMTEQQLQEFYSEVLAEYQNCLAQGLNLNMSRGKPGLEQLALSDDLLNMYIDPADTRPDGVEARNYGELMGLPACRRLFAELLGVRFEGLCLRKCKPHIDVRPYFKGIYPRPAAFGKTVVQA